jgi:hypothetical protein
MLHYATQRYATLRNATQRYATLRNATQRYATLSTFLRWFNPLPTTRISTLIPWILQNATRRYSTLRYATLRYSTLRYATLRYLVLWLFYADSTLCAAANAKDFHLDPMNITKRTCIYSALTFPLSRGDPTFIGPILFYTQSRRPASSTQLFIETRDSTQNFNKHQYQVKVSNSSREFTAPIRNRDF